MADLPPPRADPGETTHEWELTHVLDPGWVCIARAEELASPGEQRAERIGATAVLVVRGLDGCLRGFVDHCRHQGTQLLSAGLGIVSNTVVCPRHLWTYALDGRLLHAPAQESAGITLDAQENALTPVAIEEWLGFVFAHAGPEAERCEFSAHVGSAGHLLAPMVAGGWEVATGREYAVSANWKVVLGGGPPLEAGVTGPQASGRQPTGPAERLGDGSWGCNIAVGGRWVALFPNLILQTLGERALSYLLIPVGAGETTVLCDWSFPPAALRETPGELARLVEADQAAIGKHLEHIEGLERDGAGAAGLPPLLVETLVSHHAPGGARL